MYHPSILHHLNQTYPSDNESTSDGVGGTAGRMTFNSIARGMQQGNDGALLSRIQQNAGSLRARDEELYSKSSSEESEDVYGGDDDSCQYQSHLNHDGNDNNNHSNAIITTWRMNAFYSCPSLPSLPSCWSTFHK